MYQLSYIVKVSFVAAAVVVFACATEDFSAHVDFLVYGCSRCM